MTPRKEKGPPTSETNGARRYSFDHTRLRRGWNDARQLVICGIGQSAISATVRSRPPIITSMFRSTNLPEDVATLGRMTGSIIGTLTFLDIANRLYAKPRPFSKLGRGLHRSRKDRRPSRSAFRPVRIQQQEVAGEPSDHRANPLLS